MHHRPANLLTISSNVVITSQLCIRDPVATPANAALIGSLGVFPHVLCFGRPFLRRCQIKGLSHEKVWLDLVPFKHQYMLSCNSCGCLVVWKNKDGFQRGGCWSPFISLFFYSLSLEGMRWLPQVQLDHLSL